MSGSFTGSEVASHINYKEVKAVVTALEHWGPQLRNNHVNILTDNITTRAAINKFYCRSTPIRPLIEQIFNLCNFYNIHISASYVPTLQNVEADSLSRGKGLPQLPTSAEYGLTREKFEYLTKKLSCKPQVDLFASKFNVP